MEIQKSAVRLCENLSNMLEFIIFKKTIDVNIDNTKNMLKTCSSNMIVNTNTQNCGIEMSKEIIL